MFARCRSMPIKFKKQIAMQLLFPQFDYACVTFLDLTTEQEYLLQKQQNKAVRFIFSLPRYAHITPYIKKLNWLPLCLRRQYFLLTQMYKVLKFQRPLYLYNLVKPFLIKVDRDTIQTRSNLVFKIPFKTKKIYDHSFTIAAMKAWNELELKLRNIDKLSIFKNEIRKKLLRNYKNS